MIKLDWLNRTCYACPSQWEGETSEGLRFYARYRWGWLSVQVGKETILGKALGDNLDGLMEERELKFQLRDLVDFSAIGMIPECSELDDGFFTHSED
jgi:hypothetical protein